MLEDLLGHEDAQLSGSQLSQFDLAIDDMGKPDGANLQCHCCSEFLVSAQMACPYRFSHSCFDLVLPGDADFFQEFTDGSVELLFVHGSRTPVLNLFILANSPPHTLRRAGLRNTCAPQLFDAVVNPSVTKPL